MPNLQNFKGSSFCRSLGQSLGPKLRPNQDSVDLCFHHVTVGFKLDDTFQKRKDTAKVSSYFMLTNCTARIIKEKRVCFPASDLHCTYISHAKHRTLPSSIWLGAEYIMRDGRASTTGRERPSAAALTRFALHHRHREWRIDLRSQQRERKKESANEG